MLGHTENSSLMTRRKSSSTQQEDTALNSAARRPTPIVTRAPVTGTVSAPGAMLPNCEIKTRRDTPIVTGLIDCLLAHVFYSIRSITICTSHLKTKLKLIASHRPGL